MMIKVIVIIIIIIIYWLSRVHGIKDVRPTASHELSSVTFLFKIHEIYKCIKFIQT